MSTKRWLPWVIALVVVALLAWGVVRTLSARKAQQVALAAAAQTRAQSTVELAATDVVTAQTRDIAQGLAVSGALRAANSAVIKARVAGELQGLTLREGDFVKAGQVIARIDSGEYQSRVRQAQEQAESARAQADVAQRQYDNNKALVEQGFISKTALENSLANLNGALASYKSAQAATDVAGKSVSDTVLKSPIAGQVSQRMAQPGERVGIDARIIEVVDLSRLELEASLSAQESMDIRVGQQAVLFIEGSGQPVKAAVVRINPSAQAGSRSVLAYLGIDNKNSGDGSPLTLRQGLFAQGTLGTSRTSLLAVPVSSVRTDKPAPYVQTIENGQVVHRPVEPGVRGSSPTAAGSEAVVAVTGLADGAVVIRGEIGSLREGTKVRFTAMAPDRASPAASAPALAKTAP